MEKMSELTVSDVREITEGKKVKVHMESAMSIRMTDAVVVADPDSGVDGRISILAPDMGCRIELDADGLIETIYGNEEGINITLFNNMGVLDISVVDDEGEGAGNGINQGNLCNYVKDRLDRLSSLSEDDIGLILDLGMGHKWMEIDCKESNEVV